MWDWNNTYYWQPSFPISTGEGNPSKEPYYTPWLTYKNYMLHFNFVFIFDGCLAHTYTEGIKITCIYYLTISVAPKSGYSVTGFYVHGFRRLQSRCGPQLGLASSSKLIQVVSRSQFLAVTGLRFLFLVGCQPRVAFMRSYVVLL